VTIKALQERRMVPTRSRSGWGALHDDGSVDGPPVENASESGKREGRVRPIRSRAADFPASGHGGCRGGATTGGHEMQKTKPLPNAVKSFEGVLLLVLFWAGMGWLLVNRTPIPNEVFVAGSIVVVLLVVWLSFRLLRDGDE
jgi:hypothetical protein